MGTYCTSIHFCNAVHLTLYGKKEAGTGEHLNTFNQTQMKRGSPSRTTATHKTQTKSPGLVLSRLPMSSLLLLFLPKLLRGTRDRWVAQVSFIIIHSTGLAPFPRLSAPPHSSHTPIAPRRPGGTHETALYSPPPPSPGGSPSGRPRRTWG